MTAVERLADLKGHVEHLETLLAKHGLVVEALGRLPSLREFIARAAEELGDAD